MRFGVCTDYTNAPVLKELGYDYIEGSMRKLDEITEEQLREYVSMLHSLGMYAETFNGFYAAQRVVGEDVTPQGELRDYTHRVLERAARLGGKIAVYGSSKARNIPEGFSRERAYEQFCQAARLTGEIAQQYDILVALEPLNVLETNFFHTVTEGIQIMRDVDYPNVRVLADMYHMCKENEDLSHVELAGADLCHVHIAEPTVRTLPKRSDAFDYGQFACALRRAGYDRRISLEGHAGDDLRSEWEESLAVLRTYF